MIRATFLMEQHVGHRTFYQNLRKYVDGDPRVTAAWVPITYSSPSSWLNVMPLTEQLRGSLIGRDEARRGLRGSHAEVHFFFTQVPAMLAHDLLGRVPYVLSTDITPIQYDGMAETYGHRKDRWFPLKAVKRQVNTQVLRNAARVLPWTSWVQRSLIEDYGVSPQRLDVIPIGVDIELWSPRAEPTADADDGRMRILFVGADFKRKGGDSLLSAFRGLPHGSATLDIVSKTPVTPEPGVRVHRNLEPNSGELVELFRTCDVLVLPTKGDAFGIVAAEASASGLAVLMSDIGGARDIVVDGETGYLLPLNDPNVLGQRLATLVHAPELRKRMGRAARARAEEHFDARKNGKRVVDALVEVVESHRNSEVPKLRNQ